MLLRNLWCLLLISLFISACGPMRPTSYTYVPPKDAKGKVCTMQCQQSKSSCQRLCDSEAENCKSRAMGEARLKYDSYLSEQRSKGEPVEKDLNSFYSSDSCVEHCNCTTDYQSCFQLCGGELIPQTQ